MTAQATSAAPPVGDAWRQPAPLALAVVLATVVVLVHGLSARGLIGAAVAAVLVALSAVDLAERRIPNRIVLPATVAVLVAQCVFFPDRAAEWVLAAIGAALFLAIPLLWIKGGVGMGDLKLALLLGAALGDAVIDALLYASVAALVLAIVALARHGNDARGMTFPFGPFLAFGGFIALLTGHHIG